MATSTALWENIYIHIYVAKAELGKNGAYTLYKDKLVRENNACM